MSGLVQGGLKLRHLAGQLLFFGGQALKALRGRGQLPFHGVQLPGQSVVLGLHAFKGVVQFVKLTVQAVQLGSELGGFGGLSGGIGLGRFKLSGQLLDLGVQFRLLRVQLFQLPVRLGQGFAQVVHLGIELVPFLGQGGQARVQGHQLFLCLGKLKGQRLVFVHHGGHPLVKPAQLPGQGVVIGLGRLHLLGQFLVIADCRGQALLQVRHLSGQAVGGLRHGRHLVVEPLHLL